MEKKDIVPKFFPKGKHVIVRLEEIKETFDGTSIFIPENLRDGEQRNTVIATVMDVGPDAWKGFGNGEPWARVGDKVIIAKYAGVTEPGDNTERILYINDDDIIAGRPKELAS